MNKHKTKQQRQRENVKALSEEKKKFQRNRCTQKKYKIVCSHLLKITYMYKKKSMYVGGALTHVLWKLV